MPGGAHGQELTHVPPHALLHRRPTMSMSPRRALKELADFNGKGSAEVQVPARLRSPGPGNGDEAQGVAAGSGNASNPRYIPAAASCCPLRPRTTPFPEEEIHTRGTIWSFTVD